MSENVLPFTGATTVPEPPEQILEKAKAWNMRRCIVVGEDENGELVWGGSFSEADGINWLLDLAKYDLIHTKSYINKNITR